MSLLHGVGRSLKKNKEGVNEAKILKTFVRSVMRRNWKPIAYGRRRGCFARFVGEGRDFYKASDKMGEDLGQAARLGGPWLWVSVGSVFPFDFALWLKMARCPSAGVCPAMGTVADHFPLH